MKIGKTVFIPVFQSFVPRNILNTGVLDELLAMKARVVLFVPTAKRDFYKETYTSQNIVIETFDPDGTEDRKESIFKSVALLLISTNVMKFRKIKIMQKGGEFAKYLYQRTATAIFGKIDIVKKIFRWCDLNLNKRDSFGKYFEKYNPEVVFAPDVFGLGDVLMLKSAILHKVHTVGMVASWDNNTTKGLMRIIPNLLIVQNEIIRDESIKIQSVPKDIINVVGIAHYDYYKEYTPISREEFFKKLGVLPRKRLILFSPAGDKFISTDWQICEILKKAYERNGLPDDTVVLVRIHPSNDVTLNKFNPDEHFIIERPGVAFKNMGDKKNELDKNAVRHLLDTLTYSELVINVVSSIVIDAAVLDKPIITIGFEGWEKRVPFGSSVKRYHMDENMSKLLAIGGTSIVRNEIELIDQINLYLEHPEMDKLERERIVEKQCWKLDGKAKSRIASVIMENVRN